MMHIHGCLSEKNEPAKRYESNDDIYFIECGADWLKRMRLEYYYLSI